MVKNFAILKNVAFETFEIFDTGDDTKVSWSCMSVFD